LAVAFGLNVALVAGQVVFGVVAHSLGLLADAGHNLSDVAAVVVSLVAVRWARRAPTAERSYGYHRGTILAALLNAASILAVTGVIVYEGIVRLGDPQPVHGGLVVAVALLAFAINAGSALVLREKGVDLNMRAALLHMAGDAAASLGVAVAGLVILLTGFDRADGIASLFVAAVMLRAAWGLLRDSGRIFLEAAPKGVDVEEIGRAMIAVRGVREVHDLHVWEVTSGFPALSAHVLVGRDDDCHAARDGLQAVLHDDFAIEHTTLQVEHEAELLQIEVAQRGTNSSAVETGRPPVSGSS
jgi:cobalt-zinc-cadmium efflux system protein